MSETQFCPACGKENKITSKFCNSCGAKMPEVEEIKAEEVKVEETKTEEVKSEEIKSEEVKTEETKADEPKTEDVKEEILSLVESDAPAAVKPTPTPVSDTPAPNIASMTAKEIKAQQKADAKAAKAAAKEAKKQNKESSGGNAGIAVLIILLVLILCAGIYAFLFFFTNIFSTPKQKVAKAFVNTFGTNNIIAELSGYTENKNSEYVTFGDIKAQYDEMIQGPFSLNFEMVLDKAVLPEDISMAYGAGMTIHSDVDMENRAIYMNIGGKYNGTKLIDFDLFLDDADISFTENNFLSGYLTFNSESLGSDILSSPYLSNGVDDIEDEIADHLKSIKFNIFDSYEEAKEKDFNPLKENHEYIEPIVNLYDDITVESTGEYSVFEIDGKDVKCNSYEVTMTKENLITFYEGLQPFSVKLFESLMDEYGVAENEYLTYDGKEYDDIDDMFDDFFDDATDAIDEYFPDEITMTVYLNEKKGTLVALSLNDVFEIEDVELEYDIYGEFLGGNVPTDVMMLDFYCGDADNPDESVELVIENDGESTKEETEGTYSLNMYSGSENVLTIEADYMYNMDSTEYEVSATMESNDSDTKFSVESEGTLSSTDTEIDLEYDSLKLTYSDSYNKMSLTFKGSYIISILDDDVKGPKGTKYEIFKMTEDDFDDLGMELMQNATSSPLYNMFMEYFY